ncbi:11551_t:CDS:2, partial [Entrophospora sp. SA101]
EPEYSSVPDDSSVRPQCAKGLFFNAPPTALGEDEIEFAINLYVDT